MLTPRHVMFGARGGLLAAAWIAVMVLAGPWQGVGRSLGINDWLTHALAFGALVALAYLAFPHRRRNDIAVALVVLAGAAEAVQVFAGHPGASLSNWAGDAFGVGIIHLAGHIETVRSAARRTPHHTFQQIRSA